MLFDDLTFDGSRGDFFEIDLFLEIHYGSFGVECFAAVDVDADCVVFCEGVDRDVAFVDYLDACDAGVFGYALHYVWSV